MPVTASDAHYSSDDLSDVLRHVGYDKLAVTRPRVANHPATREFLEAGLQLLREDFIGFESVELDGLKRCRLFASISVARLVSKAEEADRQRDQKLQLTASMFKERWGHKNRYTEDLIAYLFRTAPQEAYMEQVQANVEQLIATASFGELVRALATAELTMVLADPLFGLHAIVEVTLPNHPRVKEFLRIQEEVLLPAWAGVYERVAAAYQLPLASQYTWLDVAVIFNNLINGVLAAARSSDGKARTLSNGDDVLTGAIFAMLPALFGVAPAEADDLYARTSEAR